MTPLRLRMIENMEIRNLTPLTQKAYVEQVSRFARHFGRSPEHLGPDEIRLSLLHLIRDKQLSASSMSVAVSALRFCYTVTLGRTWTIETDIPAQRQPKKLPTVLSPEKVAAFPGRGEKREAARHPDRLLRGGVACFRGGSFEARRDRQPAHGHPRGGR